MNVDGMSYRQWQKRNTDLFQKLPKDQQIIARKNGYHNVGWEKVQQSWKILQQIHQPQSLFDAKLKRGDLEGAINQSILEAEKAYEFANQGILELERKHRKIHKMAEKALNKYQLL